MAYRLILAVFVTAFLTVRAASTWAASAPEEGATIVGRVLDADSALPLAGAAVSLPDLDRGTTTDADGRYVLRGVPPGPHHLTIRLIGYAQRTLHALVPRDGQLEIHVALRPEPLRIHGVDIRAPVTVRGLESGDSTAFPDREATLAAVRNHPLLEEPDVFQALASGEVVLTPESPSGVHLRGGGSDQTAYLLDGIPVFSPFHAAGVSSAWNPDALSRLHVASSAPPIEHPHALSGAIDAVTRPPGYRLGAQGSVSTSQTRFTLDGPLGRSGAGYLVSVRSGFTGLVPRKNEASHLRGETGDALAKLEARAFGGRARLLAYDSENQIDAASISGAEGTPGLTAPRNVFEWHSRSLGAEWKRDDPSTTWRVVGWSASGDAASRWAAEAAPIQMASDRRDVGLLADWEHRAVHGTTVAGLRLERDRTSYRVEIDSSGALIEQMSGQTSIATAFAQHARPVLRDLELRLGSSLAATKSGTYGGPRAQLEWTSSKRLTLVASYSVTHQFVQSLRNAESIVGSVFPVDLAMVAGPGRIPVARSRQGMVAADYRPMAGARVTVQGYERAAKGLVLVAPRTGEPFAMGIFAPGSGTSRGLSIDAAWRASRCAFMATYGFQRVRLEHGDSSYVPDHAARHLLEGGVILFPGPTTSLRLGVAAAWGRRTTTALGDFEWEACNLLDEGCEFSGSPHYGGEPLGGTALPPYARVDLGVRHHWHFEVGGRDVMLAAFGMVTNLLGRKNVLTYTRSPSTGELAAVEMRPRAPLVAGLEWRF